MQGDKPIAVLATEFINILGAQNNWNYFQKRYQNWMKYISWFLNSAQISSYEDRIINSYENEVKEGSAAYGGGMGQNGEGENQC